jgi:hypothetical protein
MGDGVFIASDASIVDGLRCRGSTLHRRLAQTHDFILGLRSSGRRRIGLTALPVPFRARLRLLCVLLYAFLRVIPGLLPRDGGEATA